MFAALLAVFLSPAFASAQTPSPDDTLSAFMSVQRAVRAWQPLGEGEKLPRAVGACITLKLRGEVIARGAAWSSVVSGPDAASATVVREALASALKQGEPKLGVPNDAMREEAIRQVAQDVVISVELAGPLSAIEPATWEEAETSLRPGLDGVAVRSASGTTVIFPSQMMLTNTLPHRALGSAVAQNVGEGGAAAALDEPKKIREKQGLRMFNFRVAHAAQATAGASPALLSRGGRLIPGASPINTADLRSSAKALAAHLVLRDAASLSLDSLSLRCIALREYATGAPLDGGGMASRTAAADLEEIQKRCGALDGGTPRIVAALARVADPFPASPASFLFAMSQARHEGDREAMPVPERAACVFASTRAAWESMKRGCGNSAITEQGTAITTIKDAFAKTPETQLVAAMPWLGWAATENAEKQVVGGQLFPIAEHGTGEVIGALALRRMREQVWQHQLTATSATEDTQDMIGGIVFTSGIGEGGGGGGGNPYPTWQCVRPLAFIATMLGDPRLTETKERGPEIVRLMQAMRFLRQLQVDDATAWMYPNPELAKGGIRAATWDNSQPTDATSLTLLCVVELLKSLDKLAAEAAATKPATAPQPAPQPKP